MKLTEKCKEDFLNYYWDVKINPLPISMCKKEDLESFFDSISEIFQHALITEWFDSVSLFINIQKLTYDPLFDCHINGMKHQTSSGSFDTRLEATNEAINEANKIYNNHFTIQQNPLS